jgi:LuxR family maltose regulon positive regulatory protein
VVEIADARERARQLVPFETKLRPAYLRPGVVPRPGLDDRLGAEPDAALVLVVAPPGYGKTTLLARWSAREGRPVAWISITEADNDPMMLLTYVALALDSIEPLAEEVFAGLSASQADLSSVLLPRLARAVSGCSRPFVFMMDDVHLVQSGGALDTLGTLATHMPMGSQLVIAGRDDPELPVARLRADGRLVRLDTEHLAMTAAEGAALLRAAGVSLEPGAARALVESTEGWPAGLYLAALALREHSAPGEAAERFSGAERFGADYLRDEVLRALPYDVARFLLETSVLERMSGPTCDAVLGGSASGGILEDLARSNLFLVPLDRTGQWYRYHHLFGDMLRAELHRRDPDREHELHLRASSWFEANGDIESAIDHAHAAGDEDRLAALIWAVTPLYLGGGRTATVARWLALFSPEARTANPALVVTSAWCALTAGEVEAVDQWLAAAERFPSDTVLPDGTPAAAKVAMLSALVAKHGLSRMREDASAALALELDESLFRVPQLLFEGAALRLLGDADAAKASLAEGVRRGELLVPAVAVQCLAQLALIAADTADWAGAERLADRAIRLVDEHEIGERPANAQVFAAAAYVHAHAGSTGVAKREAKRAVALLESFVGVAPWAAIETSILLARATLLFGNGAAAREHLSDARRELDGYPDPGTLPARLAEVEAQAEITDRPVGLTAAPLTDAELRVLRYLPTHLSFAEIAEELFVSRNTVKTQAIAVYRKLEVSSRGQAVERARILGLIGP